MHLEKIHLPVLSPQGVSEKRQESMSVEEKIIRAFLKQTFPLSREGETLRQEAEEIVAAGDQRKYKELAKRMPTVEHPMLELFQGIAFSPEEEREFFCRDLQNIQITKGCRHKCTFCAAGAAEKVEMMPFAAVLQLAEKKRQWDERVLDTWNVWVDLIKTKTGFDLSKTLGGLSPAVAQVCDQEFESFPDKELIIAEKFGRKTLPTQRPQTILTNYYDSDPFDYRDTSFLHEDGTPADFGDVCAALASETRPIHITTAGWPSADRVAQRAAQKIVAMQETNPELFFMPRVSISKYEGTARRDLGAYLRDMHKVIETLAPANPTVMLFYNENDKNDQEFIQKVIEPLSEILSDADDHFSKKPRGRRHTISFYSGPMMAKEFQDDHHDVMACMPGIHLWPDGTIARQAEEAWIPDEKDPSTKRWGVPKGSRPTPTDRHLFTLRMKT